MALSFSEVLQEYQMFNNTLNILHDNFANAFVYVHCSDHNQNVFQNNFVLPFSEIILVNIFVKRKKLNFVIKAN